ncbi:hypothetical protein [Flexithrix dorotheae]|uniref:hypothetical protein n=1 Tax=Flexithrix dorotheae TaxID=70993 RepID=UPI00036E31DE|nr:hypothetical protein [Flexithrix dorotheae]
MTTFLKKQIILLATLCISFSLNAQNGLTGTINDPQLGFSFNVPDGWQAFQIEGGYMMASNNEKGLILVSSDNYNSLEELQRELETESSYGNTFLKKEGMITALSKTALSARINGQLEGTPCNGYGIMFLKPGGGNGNIFVGVEPQSYNNHYQQLAENLYFSINTGSNTPTPNPSPKTTMNTQNAPKPGDLGNKGDMLAGYKLVYITSSYGSREKIVFNFCANGFFHMNENNMSSFDEVGIGSAAIGGNSGGAGYWKFEQKGEQYILTLSNQSGQSAPVPVQLFVDEYGDQRFKINGKAFGYYGAANCN